MKFTSATRKTRRAAPSHVPWKPHGYQERAVDFLCDHGSAALFLDPGLGKTSITLEAFRQLKEARQARKMLVIAPLRVCQLVWRQEGQKWTQFRDLTFSLVHGTKKKAALAEDADIYLINPEGVPWLCEQFFGRNLPFDTVVIDELTRFKNHRAVRAKKLRPKLTKVARRWGLTGTPAPNGYMDLFGQMLMLDDGRALGKFITHFRDMYFEPGYDGFSYELRHGAAARIEERIKDMVLRMSAKDYLKLPPLVDDIRTLEMTPKARKAYQSMKDEMIVELEDGKVSAGNAAAVYSKLAQMANGAVYLTPEMDEPGAGKREVAWIHDIKLDALEELVEELAGQPLLIGYEFRHDLQRLRARFGDIPYIGAGVTDKQVNEIERRWNAGELPILACHPASAGHGLNFQGCNAAHIAWFSATWDFELYDQFIKRILRQGNEALRIFNHILQVRGTIDELKYSALVDKDATQSRLLNGLNAAILHDGVSPVAGNATEPTNEDHTMVTKLSRKSSRDRDDDRDDRDEDRRSVRPKGWGRPADDDDRDTRRDDSDEDDGEEEEEAPRRAPKGWGRRASEDEPEDDEDDEREQRGRINKRLRGEDRDDRDDSDDDQDEEDEPPASRARSMFSKGVRDKLDDRDDAEDDDGEEPEEPRERKRRSSPTKAQKEAAAKALADEIEDIKAPSASAPAGDLDYRALASAIVDEFLSRLLRR